MPGATVRFQLLLVYAEEVIPRPIPFLTIDMPALPEYPAVDLLAQLKIKVKSVYNEMLACAKKEREEDERKSHDEHICMFPNLRLEHAIWNDVSCHPVTSSSNSLLTFVGDCSVTTHETSNRT